MCVPIEFTNYLFVKKLSLKKIYITKKGAIEMILPAN